MTTKHLFINIAEKYLNTVYSELPYFSEHSLAEN